MQDDRELQKTHRINNKRLYFGLPVILIGIVLMVVNVFRLYTQKGNGMIPTIKIGATLITLQYPQFQNFIHRGDIVIFKLPLQPYSTTAMRIVGLPGEKIMLEEGHVYVDGAKIDESSYLGTNDITNGEAFIDNGEPKLIPSNTYMVLGDNRQFTSDSRTWGFVSRENIIGVVDVCLNNCK